MINRREFGKLTGITLAGSPFLQPLIKDIFTSQADVKAAQDFTSKLNLETTKNLWFTLLKGYQKHLIPEKSWGKIPGKDERWNNAKGDPELVTRTLWSLGTWFSKEGREESIRWDGIDIPIYNLMKEAIINGTNPESKGYWPLKENGKTNRQLKVEAPTVAWALVNSEQKWRNTIPAKEQKNIEAWLKKMGKPEFDRDNNWNLFFAVNHACRKKLKWEYDQQKLDEYLKKADALYADNGWYSDSPDEKVFDDYVHWVFTTHFLYWSILDGENNKPLKEKIYSRAKALNQHTPYFYGADGSHPEYGRSISYKFARLADLILAYYLGISPLSPGMIKRLVRLHISYYINNGAVDLKNGLVSQRLSSNGSLDVREVYIAPGSTYWFMQTFGALWLLNDQDEFWTAEEEQLPVEKNSFLHFMPATGWITQGQVKDGSIQLFNLSVDHSEGWEEKTYPSKYRKFCYHSSLGYLVGDNTWIPCDNMISVFYKGLPIGYPLIKNQDFSENGQIAKTVQVHKNKEHKVEISTVIFIFNDFHVRIHRIRPKKLNITYEIREGGFALGLNPHEKENFERKNLFAYASGTGGSVFLAPLKLYSGISNQKEGYMGTSNAHTLFPKFFFPYTKANVSKEETAAIMVKGSKKGFNPLNTYTKIKSVTSDNESIQIQMQNGKVFHETFLD